MKIPIMTTDETAFEETIKYVKEAFFLKPGLPFKVNCTTPEITT